MLSFEIKGLLYTEAEDSAEVAINDTEAPASYSRVARHTQQ